MAKESTSAIAVDQVKRLVAQLHLETVRVRRHLHAHPELSFQEERTAAYLAEQLAPLKEVEVRKGIAGTGLLAVIEGNGPGPVICLRGEMDALPIQETNEVPYRSRNHGVMHACGHDAHTAMVLSAGKVLHALRPHWGGTVLLLFQPGEEKVPGGASLVLQEGALDNPKPQVILGQHVTPELEVGKVGFHPGPFMASADELYLTVKGRGGHAARPEELIDPIPIAAHLLLGLKEGFEARRKGEPMLLAFGRVIADGATNVVPDDVRIAGTLRAFDEEQRARAHQWLRREVERIAEQHGGACELEIRKGYPVLVNDERLTSRMRQAAEEFLGKENVVDMPRRMGAEDFAFYSQVFPVSFHRLGTHNPKIPVKKALHTPDFNLPEESMGIGVGILVWGALQELGAAPRAG